MPSKRHLFKIATLALSLCVQAADAIGADARYTISTLAGHATEFGSVDGIGPNARFPGIPLLYLNRSGTALYTISGNQTVRRVDISDGRVTTLPGLTTAKLFDLHVGGQVPSRLVFDDDDSCYYINGLSIYRTSPSGTTTVVYAGKQFDDPEGLGVLQGKLRMTENGDLFAFSYQRAFENGSYTTRYRLLKISRGGVVSEIRRWDQSAWKRYEMAQLDGLALTDGSQYFYLFGYERDSEETGLWSMSLNGTESRRLPTLPASIWSWVVDRSGLIYYQDSETQNLLRLGSDNIPVRVLNAVTGTPITTFPTSIVGGKSGVLFIANGSFNPTRIQKATPVDPLPVKLEMLDPQSRFAGTPSSLLAGNGNLSADSGRLRAFSSRLMDGVAADGAATLLLRFAVADDSISDLTVSLEGSAAMAGTLIKPGSEESTTPVTVSLDRTSSPTMAYVYYRAPRDFSGGAADLAVERYVKLQIKSQSTALGDYQIKIARPPVLLVHGLWSGPETWSGARIMTDLRFARSVTRADYANTAGAAFTQNLNGYRGWLESAFVAQRMQGIAAVRADVIGHSMGGILSRLYVQKSDYLRGSNYNRGDVNRIITLNTPHLGSPMARGLLGIVESTSGNIAMFTLHEITGIRSDFGALADLSPGSTALGLLSDTAVRSRALVGQGGALGSGAPSGLLGAIYGMAKFYGRPITMETGAHDQVVGEESQRGGIATFKNFTHFGSIHTNCTTDFDYWTEIFRALNAAKDGPDFSFFPGNAVPARSAQIHAFAAVEPATSAASTVALQIAPPAGGLTVAPGSSVTVSVLPQPGVVVSRVFLAGPSIGIESGAAPFQFQFTVPADAVGGFTLRAYGATATDYVVSEPLVLDVVPSAAPSAFELEAPTMQLSAKHRTTRLLVYATYPDGARRRLTNLSALVIASSNPSIAMVDATGVVSAVSPGDVTVTVSNGAGLTKSIALTIDPDINAILLSASHSVIGGVNAPGRTLTVRNTLSFPEGTKSLGWSVLLPSQWSFVSSSKTPAVLGTGASGIAEWAWSAPVESPITFEYTLLAGSGASSGDLAAIVTCTDEAKTDQRIPAPDPLVLDERWRHSADSNGNGQLALTELTRVIELYNTRLATVRSGSYQLATGQTEDGFDPAPSRPKDAFVELARYHSADINRNGQVELGELLRVIQIYNFRAGTVRTGHYRINPSSEDGFEPGAN